LSIPKQFQKFFVADRVRALQPECFQLVVFHGQVLIAPDLIAISAQIQAASRLPDGPVSEIAVNAALAPLN
jgi:hypothetical protein